MKFLSSIGSPASHSLKSIFPMFDVCTRTIIDRGAKGMCLTEHGGDYLRVPEKTRNLKPLLGYFVVYFSPDYFKNICTIFSLS